MFEWYRRLGMPKLIRELWLIHDKLCRIQRDLSGQDLTDQNLRSLQSMKGMWLSMIERVHATEAELVENN